MIKKMALCAVLILILVPAFAMAAGPQGQGSDTARENCTQSQQQLASQVQTSNQLQNNGEDQMLRNCNGDQECEMSRIIARNQSQVRGSYCRRTMYVKTTLTRINAILSAEHDNSMLM